MNQEVYLDYLDTLYGDGHVYPAFPAWYESLINIALVGSLAAEEPMRAALFVTILHLGNYNLALAEEIPCAS